MNLSVKHLQDTIRIVSTDIQVLLFGWSSSVHGLSARNPLATQRKYIFVIT